MSTPREDNDQRWRPFRDMDQWWFGRGSPVALGLFRIVISLVAFASMALTLVDFKDWYTEKGFLPVSAANFWASTVPTDFKIGALKVDPLKNYFHLKTLPRIDFLNYSVDDRVSLAIYLFVMLCALVTALGLWTRVSSLLFAVGLICIHQRNALILHSGDTLMRLAVMYLALSSCGSACSLDRVIRLWKGKETGPPPDISLWGQRLIQYQTALVYFTTVWWKWFGTAWKDGSATWYPENLNEFYRFPVPDFTHRQPFIAFSTYATLVVELSLATLVFYRPLRKYVLLAGIAMHGYIEYRMNIPFFAFTIVATYICFYDGEEVSTWAKKVGDRLRRFRTLVEMPKGLQLRPGPAAALEAMDPLSLVSYDPGMERDWRAMDLGGRKKAPFWSSWVRSVGGWPCALIWKRLLIKHAVVATSITPELKESPASSLSK